MPTLLERDGNVPDLPTLLAEAKLVEQQLKIVQNLAHMPAMNLPVEVLV
jgi:uncharacterized protein (UPF0276 family)